MRLKSHGIQKGTHIFLFLTTSCLVCAGDVETHSSMLQLPCTSCRLQTATVRLSRKFLFNINRGNFIGNRSIFMIQLQCIEHQVESTQDIKVFFPLTLPPPSAEKLQGGAQDTHSVFSLKTVQVFVNSAEIRTKNISVRVQHSSED